MIGGAVNIAKKHQKRLDTVRLIMGANLRCPMRTPIFALNVRGNAPALTNLVVVVRAMRHNGCDCKIKTGIFKRTSN